MKPKGKSVFLPVAASDMFTFYQPIVLDCQTQALKIVTLFLNKSKKPSVLIVSGNPGDGKTHLIYYSCEEFIKRNPHKGIYQHRNSEFGIKVFNDPPENIKFLICDGNLWSRDIVSNSCEINRLLNCGISIIVDVCSSDSLFKKADFSKINFLHAKIERPTYSDRAKFFYNMFHKRLGKKPVLRDFFEIIKKLQSSKSLRGIEGRIVQAKLKQQAPSV